MAISTYPNGFEQGVSIRGMNVVNAHWKAAKWISSTAATNSPKGTQKRPFASIAQAFDNAETDDLFLVAPGHTETVTAAAGIDADVQGVSVIGLGVGSRRPTITFSTAVGADIDIDAANITFQNLLFVAGIDALTGPIDVNAADFAMIGCETRDTTGSYQTVDWIVADANATRMMIMDAIHRGTTDAGADTWLTCAATNDVLIVPAWIDGNFAVANIENTAAATNLTVFGRPNFPAFMRNRNSGDVIFTAHASTTGNVGPNINARLADNAANITEAFVGAAMQFFQPINIVNLNGESSMQTNITASTDA